MPIIPHSLQYELSLVFNEGLATYKGDMNVWICRDSESVDVLFT